MREGWTETILGNACQIKPPKKEAKEKLSSNDMVSFVPMKNLGVGTKSIDLSEDKPLGKVVGSYTYFAENDVLLAKITPCFENGKLGLACGLTNGIGFGSSEFIVFRPKDELCSEYLYYFLSQDSFRAAGARVMSGAVGHKRVPKEFTETYPIPLPPLPEQKRIVTILDEAFAGIDMAVANAEKNLANARELFESHLNTVFTHKGDGWEEKKLGDVCENLDSKRVPITKNKRINGPIPYYGASGIVDYVADYIFDEELLLVSEDGANLLARTYPIAFSIEGKACVNNHAHVLRFEQMAYQKFTEHYLNSIPLEPYVSGMAQPKLNQKALNSIPVPWPNNVDEAASAVEKITAIQIYTQRFKSIYQQKLDSLAELKQSMLQKAFAGELTANPDRVLKEAVL